MTDAFSNEVSSIQLQLKSIETEFEKAGPGSSQASVYALVYVLVLSSWIEERRNDFAIRLIEKYIPRKERSDRLIKNTIVHNNGIKLDTHFRNMFVNIIGEHGYLKLLTNCDETKLQKLSVALSNVWNRRCTASHNTLNSWKNSHFDSPSTSKPDCEAIFDGLGDIDEAIESLDLEK